MFLALSENRGAARRLGGCVMSAARAQKLVNGWETVRYELLNTPISDLGLQLEGSPVEALIQRLYRELDHKGLPFRPEVYATDCWGCPDEVPVIGIPFYLLDRRLQRLEEEQTGDIETPQMVMMLLRHEAGHAINYAYRLYKQPEWVEMFGKFNKPYRDNFRPDPFSREFVRHIVHHQYGRTYAQKHPDEDFAETFAVWLTPRSKWRSRYRNWPAIHKLQYVNKLMRDLRDEMPKCKSGPLCTPVENMNTLLAEHYGQRAERYRAAAQGYVDDKLVEIFPEVGGRTLVPTIDLFRKQHEKLLTRLTRWSGLDEEEAETLLSKLEDRAESLNLYFRRQDLGVKIMDVTALATALAIDFAYTGRFTG